MAVKGQETKNRLMDIAERLILENGFVAMSIGYRPHFSVFRLIVTRGLPPVCCHIGKSPQNAGQQVHTANPVFTANTEYHVRLSFRWSL